MRTGSTWLSTLLDSHPDIRCKHELLHKTRFRGTPIEAKEYLDRHIFYDDGKVNGFKVMYHQMRGISSSDCELFAWLFREFYKCKVVHIMRRNVLDSYISYILAKRSGIYNLFNDNKFNGKWITRQPDLPLDTKARINFVNSNGQKRISDAVELYNNKITIDLADLKDFRDKTKRWEERIPELFPDNIEVYYEDLPNIPGVCNYLGVSSAVKLSNNRTFRLRRVPVDVICENYDEIADSGLLTETH